MPNETNLDTQNLASIVVPCNCGARMKVKATASGMEIKCPKCGGLVRVPHVEIPSSTHAIEPTLIATPAPPPLPSENGERDSTQEVGNQKPSGGNAPDKLIVINHQCEQCHAYMKSYSWENGKTKECKYCKNLTRVHSLGYEIRRVTEGLDANLGEAERRDLQLKTMLKVMQKQMGLTEELIGWSKWIFYLLLVTLFVVPIIGFVLVSLFNYGS